MPQDTTRRALLGALLGAGVGGAAVSPAFGLLDSFAPLSGRAWRGTRRRVPATVSSPHGDATVTYDDYHVPHVEADSEPAAYFAVGYVQAVDRLFEIDLIRRLMDGRLSAALGERTVESDVFNAKMDFRRVAEASAEALEGTRTETLTEAYADVVVHVLVSPVMNAGEFLVLTPPAYVTIAAAVLAPTWGSLVRGVI